VIPQPVLKTAPGIDVQRLHSTMLSAFHGKDTAINAVVVSPAGLTPGQRVPTVYIVGGFGTTLASMVNRTAPRLAALKRPMYFVLLDPVVPFGHSVFADSANNGPWGTALVKEAIPALEALYPGMLAEPRGRFLTGHSSGGWTTLWLQITYPEFFGGTWSTAPDPVDFHNFTGPDLLAAPHQNMYVDAAGKPYNLVRYHGRALMTLKEYVELEDVEGAQGGQFESFNAVFGPRGRDGFPAKLFDLKTGAIDPAVVLAWEQYDIAAILRAHWPTLGPKLAGKLHIVVGTADTFHLNEGVALLAKELKELGSDAQITFVPGRDHLDLYEDGLQGRIFDAMEARAAATGVIPAAH
jgi:S-formylglutathione hydrolase FrmB